MEPAVRGEMASQHESSLLLPWVDDLRFAACHGMLCDFGELGELWDIFKKSKGDVPKRVGPYDSEMVLHLWNSGIWQCTN